MADETDTIDDITVSIDTLLGGGEIANEQTIEKPTTSSNKPVTPAKSVDVCDDGEKKEVNKDFFNDTLYHRPQWFTMNQPRFNVGLQINSLSTKSLSLQKEQEKAVDVKKPQRRSSQLGTPYHIPSSYRGDQTNDYHVW
jgi:hypothetical protein